MLGGGNHTNYNQDKSNSGNKRPGGGGTSRQKAASEGDVGASEKMMQIQERNKPKERYKDIKRK